VDVIAVISREHKVTGSTAGHGSAGTSDLQEARVQGAEGRLEAVKRAIAERDFATFAATVEHDSNLMHAVMMTSQPPLFYWLPASLTLMERIRQLRADGLKVCYTLDAGPNVHCICVREDAEQVRQAIASLSVAHDLIVAGVGGGVEVIQSR
jgi:diphosphomevalonate decarboxylase